MAKNRKKEPKLARLFRGLSSQDLRKLGKYLQNPTVESKHAKALLLFQYLKGRPDEERLKFLGEKVFYKIFDEEQAYELQKLREVAASLVKRIENFLVIDEATTQYKQWLLVEAQKRRGMSKLHYYNLKTLAKTEENEADSNILATQLNQELYYHPLTSKFKAEEANAYLTKAIFDLDCYYLTNRLRLYCEQYISQRFYNTVQNTDFVLDLIKYCDTPEFAQRPLLYTYLLAAKIFHEEKGDLYGELKKIIGKNYKNFSQEDNTNLITLAINMVNFFIENDKLEEFFYWYQLGFSINAFVENGVVVKTHFNNTLHVASNLKKYDWLENFIRKYEKQINLKDVGEVENVKKLIKAYILFGKKDWAGVARNLIQLKFEDLSFSLRWHVLNIKNNYEEGKQNVFLEIINCGHRFERFLSRKLNQGIINEVTYNRNHNFIKYINAIAAFNPSKHSDQNFSLIKMETEVKDCRYLVEKRWLLEKIDQLKLSSTRQ